MYNPRRRAQEFLGHGRPRERRPDDADVFLTRRATKRPRRHVDLFSASRIQLRFRISHAVETSQRTGPSERAPAILRSGLARRGRRGHTPHQRPPAPPPHARASIKTSWALLRAASHAHAKLATSTVRIRIFRRAVYTRRREEAVPRGGPGGAGGVCPAAFFRPAPQRFALTFAFSVARCAQRRRRRDR